MRYLCLENLGGFGRENAHTVVTSCVKMTVPILNGFVHHIGGRLVGDFPKSESDLWYLLPGRLECDGWASHDFFEVRGGGWFVLSRVSPEISNQSSGEL